MSVEVRVPEEELTGFSDQARTLLKEATAEFATDLIVEANRIETGQNSAAGPPEVTRGMVDSAIIVVRRGLGVPKKNWKTKVLRVLAAVLPLGVGVMYDKEALQGGIYLLLFITLIAAAILAVTISTTSE